MPHLRVAILTGALLAISTVAPGQTSVGAGTILAFDHDPESAAETDHYELCVDGITMCMPIVATRIGTSDEYRFPLPTLTRGKHTLAVRAVGYVSVSAPSNAISVRVVAKPTNKAGTP
jgi:hypothetical protein